MEKGGWVMTISCATQVSRVDQVVLGRGGEGERERGSLELDDRYCIYIYIYSWKVGTKAAGDIRIYTFYCKSS